MRDRDVIIDAETPEEELGVEGCGAAAGAAGPFGGGPS